MQQDSGFLALAFEPGIVRRAIKVALIVGTIIGAINYGDKLLAGSITARDMVKIVLTYLVPYCVSTWSAVQALRAAQIKGATN